VEDVVRLMPARNKGGPLMDSDRIDGAAKQLDGAIGELTGDAKLQAGGKLDKLSSKAKDAAVGIKDAVCDASDANRNPARI
jgi:uncharacterized protein YjbJ (UPF0337 family)